MIKQYPHYLYALSMSADSTRDGEGNWNSQGQSSSLISICREETNGKGLEIQGADGKFHKYASVVFLPKSCPDLQFGKQISIRDSKITTVDRIKGSVLKFDRGQQHCRLWL